MFGYVVVNKPELKIKEFDVYQGYYCGICKSLKKNFGNIPRIALNYDMTFVALLLSSLSFEEPVIKEGKCIIHPMSKHLEIHDKYVDYCADLSIVLSYFKCKDDYNDERKLSSKSLGSLLKKSYDKVEKKYPGIISHIEQCLHDSYKLELANTTSVDDIANETGKMMGEILCFDNIAFKNHLYKLGFYLGKFIYVMDAYEDIEEDIEKNNFNVLIHKKDDENFEQWVEDILTMFISKACDEFECLPITENYELLKNILYSGIWTRYYIVRKKRGEKNGSV